MSSKNNDYLAAAKQGQKIIINYWLEVMDDKSITIYKLAQLSGVPQSTLRDYFNNGTDMSLINYLRINGALNLRAYLVPSEIDDTEMINIHFN